MGFVIAAYLLITALFVGYALTLTARRRLITDLAEAVGAREPRA